MFKRLTMLLIGIAGLAWLSVNIVAQGKADKADDLAKKATEQFLKAMKAEDIEAVMKAVEVPFSWDGDVKVVDNPDELKEAFAKVFADKDMTHDEHTILEIHTFAPRLKESSQDLRFLEAARRGSKEVLVNDDRVVIVVTRRNTSYYGLAVSIRIREGKARVAGFYD